MKMLIGTEYAGRYGTLEICGYGSKKIMFKDPETAELAARLINELKTGPSAGIVIRKRVELEAA